MKIENYNQHVRFVLKCTCL